MQTPPFNLFVQHCQILEVDSQWKYIVFKVQRIARSTVFIQGLYLLKTKKNQNKTKIPNKQNQKKTTQTHLRQ